MSLESFTAEDIRQIRAEGLTEAQVLDQIELFKKKIFSIKLNSPCSIGDGIVVIPEEDKDKWVQYHERECRKGRMIKFVPASGAASRLFKEWFKFLDEGCFDSEAAASTFSRDLRQFAFFKDLLTVIKHQGSDLESWVAEQQFKDILIFLLTEKGLNYGDLPKALLKFHAYPDGSRTAIEEHLAEAALYVQDGHHICRIHFTVSMEHEEKVRHYLSQIQNHYEKQYGVTFDIDISIQSSSTNTISVDREDRPFRDEQGRLVFRPGGHGALLFNLNSLIDGDIVFLKNIDNIVPDRLKSATVLYKKMISGYLINLQEQIFLYLTMIADGQIKADDLEAVVSFCREKLYIIFPSGFKELPLAEKQNLIFSKLNRPLRVCGVVKNEGEPGGGPFWVDEEDGTRSLQIIEESQIAPFSDAQRALWSKATHFNPVDLVCGVRDYRQRKFDLNQFVNQNTFSISQKSEKGRDIQALELPGLWNGSMAHWITIFVEVPVETFNPVKTINDLLRPQHLSGS